MNIVIAGGGFGGVRAALRLARYPKNTSNTARQSSYRLGAAGQIFEWKGLRFGGPLGAVIRRFADLLGYMDILPLSRALAIWQWGGEPEDAYFTPASRNSGESSQ